MKSPRRRRSSFKVRRAIKTAKLKYKNKVEEKLIKRNLRLACQRLKTMAAVTIAATNQRIIKVADIPHHSPMTWIYFYFFTNPAQCDTRE